MSWNVLWKAVAYVLAVLSLLPTIGYFLHPNPPWNYYLVILPLVAAALAPILALSGGLGVLFGIRVQAWPAAALGLIGAGLSLVVVLQTSGPHRAFDASFPGSVESASRAIPPRRGFGLPRVSEPLFEPDIPFAVVPDTDRTLLCDLWEPGREVERSGVAVVFLHGGAWYLSDKDFGTRPFFRQLASRGHVVMDVAYRLAPEVEMRPMVGDVLRAVAWMKDHAADYGVNPERIVLAGASSGGHLALLAAYSPGDSRLTPPDLMGRDLGVRAVLSLYGPVDLAACYDYWDQERTLGMPPVEIGAPGAAAAEKSMDNAGRLDILLGGHLPEVPESYALLSPINHVHPGAPPTFLYQGKRDVIAPVESTVEMEHRLRSAGVPVVNVLRPWINHAFDLITPTISPAARALTHDVLLFLELTT